MNNEYRLRRGRRTPILSAFLTMPGILLFAAFVIVCITAWPDPAVYGTGIADTGDGLGFVASVDKGQGVPSAPATSEGQQLGLLQFVASGRVRIEVHDPEGNIVSRDQNQIEGAIFQDEGTGMVIDIPNRLAGDYKYYVYADGSANPIHLFDVSVTDGVDTIQLADREMIVNAPRDPYVIRSSEEGLTDVTSTADSGSGDDEGTSSSLIWILAGSAGLIVGIVLFIRSRRRKR